MFILRAPKYENLLIIYLIIVVQSQYYIRGLTLTDDVKAHPLLQYFLNKNPHRRGHSKRTDQLYQTYISPMGRNTLPSGSDHSSVPSIYFQIVVLLCRSTPRSTLLLVLSHLSRFDLTLILCSQNKSDNRRSHAFIRRNNDFPFLLEFIARVSTIEYLTALKTCDSVLNMFFFASLLGRFRLLEDF